MMVMTLAVALTALAVACWAAIFASHCREDTADTEIHDAAQRLPYARVRTELGRHASPAMRAARDANLRKDRLS